MHGLVGCQALLCAEAAACWWVGLGHKATVHAASRVPRASADPPVSETGSQGGRLWA